MLMSLFWLFLMLSIRVLLYSNSVVTLCLSDRFFSTSVMRMICFIVSFFMYLCRVCNASMIVWVFSSFLFKIISYCFKM